MVDQTLLSDLEDYPHALSTESIIRWHSAYGGVLSTSRDDDDRFRYFVIGTVSGSTLSWTLQELLGVSTQDILDYLEERVVNNGVPEDGNVYKRPYWRANILGQDVYITDWKYLYNIEVYFQPLP